MHSRTIRLFAFPLCALALLAAPALAVSHGWAHHEAREHLADHDASDKHDTGARATGEEHQDHQHPQLDPTTTSRAPVLIAALPAVHVILPVATVTLDATPARPDVTESPPSAGERAPPRSRAPPSL